MTKEDVYIWPSYIIIRLSEKVELTEVKVELSMVYIKWIILYSFMNNMAGKYTYKSVNNIKLKKWVIFTKNVGTNL